MQDLPALPLLETHSYMGAPNISCHVFLQRPVSFAHLVPSASGHLSHMGLFCSVILLVCFSCDNRFFWEDTCSHGRAYMNCPISKSLSLLSRVSGTLYLLPQF